MWLPPLIIVGNNDVNPHVHVQKNRPPQPIIVKNNMALPNTEVNL